MKLLLTSGGFTNQTIAKALLDLAGKPFSELKLAFVPTAADVEDGHKDWLINDLYRCLHLGFAEIDIVDIAALPRKIWEPRLRHADILMFGGGNTYHLRKWLRKSGLDKMLPKLLETRVYVGISAGSMVAGKGLPLTSDLLLYYEKIGHLKDRTALDLVNLSIRPHLNNPDFPKVTVEILAKLSKHITKPVYALDDNSALVVNDRKISVVSEGVWKRFN